MGALGPFYFNQLTVMPTLDDAPTIAPMSAADVAGGDLVQIYDVSAQKPRTISVTELADAIDAILNP